MDWITLAQSTIEPEATIGWLERILRGGPALISLAVAVLAGAAAVIQYRKNAELEAKYRQDLEDRARSTAGEADKRLAEAKSEAKERAAEIDKLMRERMAVERESDATLAKAVLALEGNTKMLEKLDRLLEDVKQSLGRVHMALDRRST